MSYNCKPEKMPGTIKGNPMTGLCERACIQVDKVFDACVKQFTGQDSEITLTDIVPSNLVAPFKFISAASIGLEAKVNNLVVSPLPDNSGCARVTCTVDIPINVVFIDATGKQGVGKAVISVPRDIVMHVPSESVIPYNIVADATIISTSGRYICGDTSPVFSITYCATIIMKVIMKVQLLVPSYGYAYLPPCTEYTQDVCDGLFDLPIYPNDCSCN